MSEEALLQYYEARAEHYDGIYAGSPPPWVALMVADLQRTLTGRRVLEVACGTGHWTELAAAVAEHVTAADASPAMRAIAATTLAECANVRIAAADAYRLEDVGRDFTGGLAMQWLSHVPRARWPEFLTGWHACLVPGAQVFLADNQLTPPWDALLVQDGADSYEPRELPDGTEHLVLKNYPSEGELRVLFAPYEDLRITMGERWWWLSYRLPG
jgi:SAM-dependent methyltransferase